ncbi:MAG: tetratricopeptide repeat protein [Actinomycetota bacterium]|nr:tetratricopeptide repeat protein [Actinomycetota bacterium]
MLEDRYGLELSTSSDEARDAYVDAIDRMLAADGRVEEALAATIEADPSFALAHAAEARQHQLLARGKQARASAETAVELAAGATSREQRHVEIISNLVSGQVPTALQMTHEHLAQHPRDAFVLAPACGVFGSIGFSGRIDREAEQLALLEPLATHYGDDWWFLTVHAFALLETGNWALGRELAEQSLQQRPDNSHGAHTLAHALYEGGSDDEARTFMGEWLSESDRDSLMHCHNWWHYSMLLMMAGDHEAADRAFRENCLPGATGSPSINVFTDSASYLWRSELAGMPRNVEHWQTVNEYYQEQFRRPIVFVDAHAGLVPAALGETDELAACIAQLQELGEGGRLPAGTLGATLTEGYAAFAAENWAGAIDILEPVIAEVVRIGGSRAQRDLQTNTLLAAYVNDGRAADAEAFLADVADRQPSRPVTGLSLG